MPPKTANGIDRVAISDLVLDPANARKGNVPVIVESLKEFGQHRPAVVQRSTNRIVVGNHMVQAAQALGWSEVDVLWVDDDDVTAVRRAIADNATGDRASWDKDALAQQIAAVGDVPGLTDAELRELKARLEPEEDDQPQFPIVPNMNERYSYVVIVASSDIDDTWLQETFDLRMEIGRPGKRQKVALSRVVDVARFRELIKR